VPPSPDSQSLTRLLVSAGIFLVVAAFVVPGLVLRDTGVLTISRKDLGRLTPTAKAELERRQEIARDAGVAAPYIGLVILLAGASLICLGIPRLKRQEQSDEERRKMELDKLREELRPQSPEERRERLREDVKEDEEGSAPGSRPPSAGTWLQEAGGAEKAVLARLAEIAPPLYDLESQVVLEGDTRLLLDGLLLSEIDQLADIVVEIKYSRGAGADLGRRVRTAREQLLHHLASYRRPAIGWLIVVVAETPSNAQAKKLEELVTGTDDNLRLSIVSLADLEQLRLPL